MVDRAAGDQTGPAARDDPGSVAAAEDAALRILRGAAQSAAGLQRRLQDRGFTEEAAAAATAAMVRHGYVDDVALAASLAGKGQRTGHGRAVVAAQLRARGVSDEARASALAGIDAGAERAAALELARRLTRRPVTGAMDEEWRRRLFGRLQRRGFDTETAHWVLRELDRAPPEETPLGW